MNQGLIKDPQSGEDDYVSSILIWKSIKFKSEADTRVSGFSVVVSVRWMLSRGLRCGLRQIKEEIFT